MVKFSPKALLFPNQKTMCIQNDILESLALKKKRQKEQSLDSKI